MFTAISLIMILLLKVVEWFQSTVLFLQVDLSFEAIGVGDDHESEPVWFVAVGYAAMSAIVESGFSPEHCDTTAV